MRHLILFWFFSSFLMASAQGICNWGNDELEIGVVMFRDQIPYSQIAAVVEEIVNDVAEGDPSRVGPLGKVNLVIQMEVSWAQTEPDSGRYDFLWYQRFAEVCAARRVKWTPLLSFHYLPDWIIVKYGQDSCRDFVGLPRSNFSLPICPSSNMWKVEAIAWLREFIVAMADNSGVSYLGEGNPIGTIFLGNAFSYPDFPKRSEAVSFDSASLKNFQERYGPSAEFWGNVFWEFRLDVLADLCIGLTERSRAFLDQLGYPEVISAVKLSPYDFPRSTNMPEALRKGFSPASLEKILASQAILAINSFPLLDSLPNCFEQWGMYCDYDAVREFDDLPLYISEFNLLGGSNPSLSKERLVAYIHFGAQMHHLRHFTFFAWNPNDPRYRINADQILAIREVMNCIVPAGNANGHSNEWFKLFPNPTGKMVWLYFEGPENVSGVLTISNSMGQLIYSKDQSFSIGEKTGIDFGPLPTGVYLVSFVGPSVQFHGKVIHEP